MFRIMIKDDLYLELLDTPHAQELFDLCITNKAHLSPWLPWINHIHQLTDTLNYVHKRKLDWANHQGLDCAIFYRQKLCGIIGFPKISSNSLQIGYWLDASHQKKGIMTLCTQKMIELAWEYYNIHRIEIICATQNTRSQNIPKKLGFEYEGLLKDYIFVNDLYLDGYLYSLINPYH